MEDICRICMISTSDMIPMVEEIEKNEFEVLDNGHKFEQYLNIKLEDLPLCYSICSYCNNLLEEFHRLKILALDSHRKLKQLQKSKNIRVEVKKEISYETNKLNRNLNSGSKENKSKFNPNTDMSFEDNIIKLSEETKESDESQLSERDQTENGNESFRLSPIVMQNVTISMQENNDEQMSTGCLNFEDYLDSLLQDATEKCSKDNNSTETDISDTVELDNAGECDEYDEKEEKNINVYSCSFCDQRFSNEISFLIHENVHKGIPPYKCNACNKILANRQTYRLHIFWHNNIRPFKCTMCSRRFLEKRDLKVHMRRHVGLKPYVCHICGRQFTIHVHLTYHLDTHGPHKHKCPHCESLYKTKRGLKDHIYAVHEKEVE